jgi:hypothetical protein
MKPTKFIAVCFYSLIFACNVFGQTNPKTVSEIERIIKILEQSAKVLDYEALKSSLHPDKWEIEENKNLLESHAYYTLLGKDFDNSTCLLPDGKIFVTILVFKEIESARQQIAQTKKYHLGNMVKVTQSDDKGYYVEEVNGVYAAVIKDAKVIFFEDRSGVQGEVIKSLANDLH